MSQAAFSLLEHSLNPMGECLTPESAARILRLKASDEIQSHIDELAEKCNEGILTPDERAEYEMFVWVGEYISGLQAKARHLLAAA
jgi:hypothetical protein